MPRSSTPTRFGDATANTAALVRRLLSDDYADKVIVTTIQKLGLALDEGSKRNKQRSKSGQPTFKEMLATLQDKRIVFIFDECHRSQFGDNHQAIKAFFPRAQLFGFTGTPIFDQNASQQKIEDTQASMRTTEDLFQQRLHAYTITHAIEDGNVLRFHIDYFKPEGSMKADGRKPAGDSGDNTSIENAANSIETPDGSRRSANIPKKAVIEAILYKHDAATGARRFNAIRATASINDAIEYYGLFQSIQAERQATDPDFQPLQIACVFSPPAEGNPDVKQIQEDLPQEQADNQVDPEGKKAALQAILADYNATYGTNHRLAEFDQYYQDVQNHIKDQQWPHEPFDQARVLRTQFVCPLL